MALFEAWGKDFVVAILSKNNSVLNLTERRVNGSCNTVGSGLENSEFTVLSNQISLLFPLSLTPVFKIIIWSIVAQTFVIQSIFRYIYTDIFILKLIPQILWIPFPYLFFFSRWIQNFMTLTDKNSGKTKARFFSKNTISEKSKNKLSN